MPFANCHQALAHASGLGPGKSNHRP
ncbi:hypothetical protein CCACVL1_30489 [Corchorus capsularis]|uniref:Uncharacterized protein n=1 Tax=Corchorus capsularis TaxID=210143 RepID=A0A1R3FWY9_COCAP|nr:hypothetical protein CCACVL1_30489 [Corchorus capsularis]